MTFSHSDQTMKKYLTIMFLISLLPILQGCTDYGKMKTYNGVDLYHKAPVTDAEAERLGIYLIGAKFADSTEKSVQITRVGPVYQFRFVIKEANQNDTALFKYFKVFSAELSNEVFNGAPVDIHICDNHFKTIRIFPYEDLGRKKLFDGVELFYTADIKPAEADSLGNYLIKSEFADGSDKVVQIAKNGSTYRFSFTVNKGAEEDTVSLKTARLYAGDISKKVFSGAPVEIQLHDTFWTPLKILTMIPSKQ